MTKIDLKFSHKLKDSQKPVQPKNNKLEFRLDSVVKMSGCKFAFNRFPLVLCFIYQRQKCIIFIKVRKT